MLLEPAHPSVRQEGSSTGQKGLLEPRPCSGLRPSLSIALPSTHPVLSAFTAWLWSCQLFNMLLSHPRLQAHPHGSPETWPLGQG